MAEYIVLWDYRSSLGGPWTKGEQITLDAELAAAINRDSPGVLAVVALDSPPPRPPDAPPQDRMQRPAARRDRDERGRRR